MLALHSHLAELPQRNQTKNHNTLMQFYCASCASCSPVLLLFHICNFKVLFQNGSNSFFTSEFYTQYPVMTKLNLWRPERPVPLLSKMQMTAYFEFAKSDH